MAIKNRIAVRILGQDHYLITTDELSYVHKVAKLVDDRMQAVMKSNSALSHTKIAVLTALNLADDLTKSRQTIETLETQLQPVGQDCSETQEEIQALIEQIDESEAMYQEVLMRIEEVSDQRGKEKNDISNLINNLKKACGQVSNDDVDAELIEAQNRIRILESELKLRESEIEEYIRVFDELEQEQLEAYENEIIYKDELEK
jgi:cell division protein ZapA